MRPVAGTSRIRAYRLALGVSLADVVAQIRAWYASEGRAAPRFSETLLSAYESGQKRPGPEYLHYLCAVYRAEPPDLGYPGPCFCGRAHGGEWTAVRPSAAGGGTGRSGRDRAVPPVRPATPRPAQARKAARARQAGTGGLAGPALQPSLAGPHPVGRRIAAVGRRFPGRSARGRGRR